MTLLLFSALLAIASAGWVIAPMVRHRFALLGDPVPGGIIDAEAHKHVALTSLREVEYDYIAGKLDEADYHALRERLSREALEAIRTADQAHLALNDGRGEPGEPGGHSCGFVNPAGSRFCAGCGAPLS